ncbi:hypothetical protein KCU62_g9457, partial [Aureobasidium sp. EXF-3399]
MCAADAPSLMLFILDQSRADPQKLFFCGSGCAIQKGNGIVDLIRSFKYGRHFRFDSNLLDIGQKNRIRRRHEAEEVEGDCLSSVVDYLTLLLLHLISVWTSLFLVNAYQESWYGALGMHSAKQSARRSTRVYGCA